MNIDQQSVDNLNATITIHIDKEDYRKKYNSKLSKTASTAQMKGFRKGKAPLSTIKKMYGRNLLAEVVNDTLQNALSTYLKDQNLKILGQPLPSDDQDGDLVFDVNDLQDYTFKYDIGLSPEVDVQGVSESDVHDIYKITIDDKTIDVEIENAKKRLGTQEHPEGAVLAGDIIKIEAEEMEDDKLMENGWATEFSVLVDSLTDEYREKVLSLSTGDTFTFDISNLEKDKKEDYIKKYLLNVPPPADGEEEPTIGNIFSGKIVEISRLKEAEMGQEFYDQYFGEGEVSTEEEARAKVEEYVGKHYQDQALQLMYRGIMDKLIADTEIDLPETFLKKWIRATNENLSDTELDNDFPGFLDNMKWTLIKTELAKKFAVEVTPEDIKAAMTAKVRQYFGQYGQQMDDSMLSGVMENMLQNQEEVNKTYEELQAGNIFKKIGETVKHNEIAISLESFNNKVQELNAKFKPAAAAAEEE